MKLSEREAVKKVAKIIAKRLMMTVVIVPTKKTALSNCINNYFLNKLYYFHNFTLIDVSHQS